MRKVYPSQIAKTVFFWPSDCPAVTPPILFPMENCRMQAMRDATAVSIRRESPAEFRNSDLVLIIMANVRAKDQM